MPITVRYDRDLGNMYAQAIANSRSRQQQYVDPNEDPETDANPFTMSAQRGAQINARLRQDRERLGAEQKEKYGADAFKDSYGGFNWQNPITIWQDEKNGVRTGKIVYENLGVDPLATGGFGALGSGEKHVYDYNDTIDTRNAEDLKKLGDVAGGGYGRSQTLPHDFFFSDLEKKRAEEARQRAINQEDWKEKQRFTDQMRDENNSLAYQRKVESDLQKERARNQRQQQSIESRQNFINDERQKGVDAELKAYDAAMEVTLGSILEGQSDGYQLSPSNIRKVEEIRQAADKIRGDNSYTPRAKAQALEQLMRQLDNIKPSRVIQPQESPEQQMQRQLDTYRQKKAIDQQYEQPKPAFNFQQVERAKKAFYDQNGFEPTQEQLQQILQRDKATLDQLNQGAQGTEQNPIQARSLEDLAGLPSGTVFVDPMGVKRRIP